MSDYLRTCEQAARSAGAVLLEKLGRVAVRHKGPADLVTEADEAAQEVVRATVLGAYPDHDFVGEEAAKQPGPARPAGRFRWIVDPLDGTTNFVHQVPHFSVSVALEEAGELLAATVFDPAGDECFTAARGRGARLNGVPIRVSAVTALGEALAAVGFPATVPRDCPDVRMFLEAVTATQSIRRTGSAALNLAYVASGRFDAAWSFSTRSWDIAAGTLLVREAGGHLAAPDGSALKIDSGWFLAAATPPLLRGLVRLARQAGVAGSGDLRQTGH